MTAIVPASRVPPGFAGFLAGAAFVRAGVAHPSLSQPAVLRAVAMSGAYLCLIGLIALGLGAIVRHGAAAIAVLFALVFAAPPGRVSGTMSLWTPSPW